MRALLLIALALAGSACNKAPAPLPPPTATLPAPSTEERLAGAIPDKMKVHTDLDVVRNNLRAWRAEHDGFPASLEAMALTGLNYPQDLSYDPQTGIVKSLTYPDY
jgi:hypothetical protein